MLKYLFTAGSSTLPRAQTRGTETTNEKVTAATSSTSLYDNVGTGPNQNQPGQTQQTTTGTGGTTPGTGNNQVTTKENQRQGSQTNRQTRDRGTQQETSTMTSNTATGPKTVTASVGTQNNVGSQVSAKSKFKFS